MADEENTSPSPDPNPAVPPVVPEPVLESPETGDDYVVEEEAPQDMEMNRGPAVGAGPTKALVTGFILFVVVGVILWSLFSGTSEAPTPEAKNIPTITPSTDLLDTPTPPPPVPVPTASTGLSSAPSVPPVPPPPPPPAVPPLPPPPPKFTGTTTPLPPPPKPGEPPPTPSVDTISPIATGGDIDQAKQARMRSNMLILDGSNATKDTAAADSSLAGDANSAFQSNVLKNSKAEKEGAGQYGPLNITVAQGKIIHAVLETAVNTDLPGPIRAIISRDVYTESGRDVAVPKGSRLIGVYNSSVLRGQNRVFIIWTRILRPDGIDIMVGSPGVDSLGRAGIYGITDNKYTEIFSSALLTSVISIGVAIGAETVSGEDTSTTTNSNGTTTSGGAGALAAADTVRNLGGIGKDIVGTMLDLKPTITVDQGTLVNVFVNKDLTFPISSSGTQFIE